MKCLDIDLAMRKVLRHVFVNMPWSYRGLFIDLVVENRMNVELGFAAADLESCSPGEVCEAVSRIRQRGGKITFHGPFWDLNIGSVDPAIREVARSRFESLFCLIQAVLPERVVLHTGFDPRHHRSQRGEWVENALLTLEPFVRRAELLDSTLVFENVFEEDPALHLELLERIKSRQVGFCLDVGHQHAFSKTALDIWLQAVWPYLKEVHLHDNDSSLDAHLPVGSGTIDFDLLFGFLLERGICPLLTIEPHTVEHLYETLAGLARLASFDAFLASVA
ncbi:MAG: sugar phosphate isomerase/epimerase family protein [Syntrophobacteraceae bacterium]